MTFQHILLGDFITLKRGYDLPNNDRKDGAVPVVSSSGVTGTHAEAKVKGPGVVTGRYGTLGEVFFVEQDFWPLNTALYVQDFKGNSPRFVSYFLREELMGLLSDKAAVPGVNRNDLHARKVFTETDHAVQEQIAEVLSRYDDLITNNTRRIELLERSARLLFEEWFVRLRYPGHEHDKIVDGVPQGWERKKLGEVFSLSYGKALPETKRVPGDFLVYGSSGEVGTHQEKLVPGPGIVVGRKGNVGSVYWVDSDFWPIDTVYFVEPDSVSLFGYHMLSSQSFENSDAAVPGLNRDYAHGKELKWPSAQLRDSYEQFVKPLFLQRGKLIAMNARLHAARDHLLPRLMDGRIEA
jgi:type I restriction enzyme, S subunit